MIHRILLPGLLFAGLSWGQALNGIAHVAYRVSDLAQSRAFYQKLGYEQFHEATKDGKVTQAFLKINDQQFIELYPRIAGTEPLGLMHICYEAANADALQKAWAAKGVDVPPARTAGAGNVILAFKDPEGTTVEATQYMPGSRHTEDRGKHLGANRLSDRLTTVIEVANDPKALADFYTSKLGFAVSGSALRLPGDSNESIRLVAAPAKSGLVFSADDTRRVATELANRGLTPQTGTPSGTVQVADPDGNTVAFVAPEYPAPQTGLFTFDRWPRGYSPEAVGKRIAEEYLTRPYYHTSPNNKYMTYPEVCTWYGALTFASLTHDKDLAERLIKRFQPLMDEKDQGYLVRRNRHVDITVFGVVPLEIYMQTKEQKYLDFGRWFPDEQWKNPRPDGLTEETRFWIDDMYMITAVEVQAFRATGERKYLDRAAKEMVAYLDKLQKPNGLFHHADDVPFFWGRGNGWVAAGMAELLRSLPPDHPDYPKVLAGYRKMMKALLDNQGPDGMWRQLLDRSEAWPETSGSGMFTFAMVTGVKNGWLDQKTYGAAARRAWIALVGYIDQQSKVTNVCEGTNKLNNLEYYLFRPRKTGDLHGQAPILWTASALLRDAVTAK
jgi:unsaturated rhamnogalacturonyl hydrolase